ncbi:MAG: hypothetical protein ACFFC7_12290 [Candidatus Hermodarchaeota archaeon]
MTKSLFIQGLAGVGLVGLKVVEALNQSFKKSKVVKTYPEFFPSAVTIINGHLVLPGISISHMTKDDISLYSMTGDQPRNPLLTHFFLKSFEDDMRVISSQSPLDLYIAFGANMINFNPSLEDFDLNNKAKRTTAAEEVLKVEVTKPREIVLICSTNELKSTLLENPALPPDISLKIQDYDFLISGLNGVLPSFVTQKLAIPSVAAMVEASVLPPETPLPSLAAFLGLCSARKGVQWLQTLCDIQGAEKNLDNAIAALKTPAIRELSLFLGAPNGEQDSTEDKRMYV